MDVRRRDVFEIGNLALHEHSIVCCSVLVVLARTCLCLFFVVFVLFFTSLPKLFCTCLGNTLWNLPVVLLRDFDNLLCVVLVSLCSLLSISMEIFGWMLGVSEWGVGCAITYNGNPLYSQTPYETGYLDHPTYLLQGPVFGAILGSLDEICMILLDIHTDMALGSRKTAGISF